MLTRTALILTAWVWSCTSFCMETTPPEKSVYCKEWSRTPSCCGLWLTTKGTGIFDSDTRAVHITYTTHQKKPFRSLFELCDLSYFPNINAEETKELLEFLSDHARTQGIDMMTTPYHTTTPGHIHTWLQDSGFKRIGNDERGIYLKKLLKVD